MFENNVEGLFKKNRELCKKHEVKISCGNTGFALIGHTLDLFLTAVGSVCRGFGQSIIPEIDGHYICGEGLCSQTSRGFSFFGMAAAAEYFGNEAKDLLDRAFMKWIGSEEEA